MIGYIMGINLAYYISYITGNGNGKWKNGKCADNSCSVYLIKMM